MPTTSPMIKSAKDGEEEAKSSHSSQSCPTSGEIFLIYRTWFFNLPIILGIKYINVRDEIS